MPSKFGAQLFGESFNRAFELQTKLRQREEEFNRELNFRERQEELDREISRANLEERQRYNAYLESSGAERFSENFIEVPEETPGAEVGESIKNRVGTFGDFFDPNKYYLDKDLVPQAPQSEFPKVWSKYSVFPDPDNPGKYKVEYHGGLKPEDTLSKDSKEPKVPKLKQYEMDALNRLISPVGVQEQEPPDPLTNPAAYNAWMVRQALRGGDKEFNQTHDFNTVANALLDGSSLEWLDRTIKSTGYPTPRGLALKLKEAGDSGELTVEQGKAFKNFLTYYSRFYQNLKQPETYYQNLPKIEMEKTYK